MKTITSISLAVALALIPGTGCRQLPGSNEQQGAVIGGAGGAITGAAVAHNSLLGALIGGALGAAGGYLIGANKDRILGKDKAGAEQSVKQAQASPATAQQARTATTADINSDGFVTLDEVAAMKDAGFSDEQMLTRLSATDQVFELTPSQEQYLRDRGVSQNLINQMTQINREQRQELLNRQSNDVISQPAR